MPRRLLKTLREFSGWLYGLPSSEVANALVFFGLVINTLLLAATAILAVYSYRQWKAVDQTLQEIRKQTPAVLQSGQAAEVSAETAKEEAASSDASTKQALGQMKRQSDAASILANATKSLANTSETQLDLSERPMLVLSGSQLAWLAVNKDAYSSYGLNLKIENHGRSPATNTAVLSNLIFLGKGDTFGPQKEIDQTCHEEDKVGPLAGIMIAPEAKDTPLEVNELAGQVGSLRAALSNTASDPQSGNRTVIANLTVCLLYRSPFSQHVRHTGLLYMTALTFSSEEVHAILSGSMKPSDMITLQSNRINVREMNVMNGIAD